MSTASPPRAPSATAAARAETRARRRMGAAVADFFLPDDARLDDRARAMAARVLGDAVGALDLAIRRHAARLLGRAGPDDAAERLLRPRDDVARRLSRAGLLPDELVEEMIARVRHDAIAAALPVTVAGPDEPSLLVRLAGVPDTVVAAAAAALLAAENRRQDDAAASSELPAELHHRLACPTAAS